MKVFEWFKQKDENYLAHDVRPGQQSAEYCCYVIYKVAKNECMHMEVTLQKLKSFENGVDIIAMW